MARYALLQGLVAPYVFLWVIGAGFFLIIEPLPLMAFSWTAIAVVFGAGMVITTLKDSRLVARCLKRVAEHGLRLYEIKVRAYRIEVGHSADVFVEIATRAAALERRRGQNANIRQVIGQAYDMVAFAFELARSGEADAEADEVSTGLLRELTAALRVVETLEVRDDPGRAAVLMREAE
jgi:hypothetical protein